MSTKSYKHGHKGVMVVFDPDMIKLLKGVPAAACDGRIPAIKAGVHVGGDVRHDTHIILPLKVQLGLPLQYCVATDMSAMYGDTPYDNEVLRILSLDVDPTSPTFGVSAATANTDITLSRIDFQDLDGTDAKAIEAFARLELADIRALQNLNPSSEEYDAARARAIEAAPRANPEHFASFREQYKKGLICQTCGVPRGWRDTALSACSTCKATVYCSKACQSKDWKIHKASGEHKGNA